MTSNLYRALREASRKSADAPAMTFLARGKAPRSYSYSELFDAAESIAESMVERGLTRLSSPLGLLLYTQEDQVLHYLAGLYTEAVPAILTPPNPKLNRAYYERTMVEVLRRSNFAAIVSDIPLAGHTGPTYEPHTLQPDEQVSDGAFVAKGPPLDAPFLQFSSGTTGIKRGVLIHDQAALDQLNIYSRALGVDASDTVVSWLPLYHDMGFVACLNMPLFCRAHVVMIDPIDWVRDPAALLRAVSMYDGTLSWNPNFAYSFMAKRVRESEINDVDLSSVRGLVNCSEPTTLASQEAFLNRFAKHGIGSDVFKGCYAMAETTFALTHGEPHWDHAVDDQGAQDDVASRTGVTRVSVGRPLDGVFIEVRDSEGRVCRERSTGELWVRSPFNFSGYYQQAEATAEVVDGDWYRTGDLGYEVNGSFFVSGRVKDVLIVGGANVFPEDLEREAAQVEGILEGRVAAFSDFDETLQTERITLLAESDLVGPLGTAAVLEVRQRIVASFQVSNLDVTLVPPTWLVKSSSGKVARGANREKWLQDGGKHSTPPYK